MLNDFGDNDGYSKSGGYQLAVSFDNENELKDVYSILKDGSTTITPIEFTECRTNILNYVRMLNIPHSKICNQYSDSSE